ncbi:MAG: lipopolysaccharide biosynthesis protein [Polyangiaceae bacterium]|nr:lipopolysaccharide biosynthesis protein [Polyangiaceae bacterium]
MGTPQARRIRELSHRTVRGGLWLFGGTVGTNVARLGVTAALARLVLPEEYGLNVEASVLLGLLAVAVEVGLGQAMIQRKDLLPQHESTSLTITLLVGAASALLLAGGASSWAAFRGIPALTALLQILAISLIFRATSSVPRMLMMRELRFKEVSVVQFAAFIAQSITSVALAAAGYGALALAWGAVAGSLVDASLTFQRRPIARPLDFHWARGRELLSFGGGLTVARMANTVALQSDNLVVGMALGPAALGLYSRAYSVLAIPAGLLQSIDGALFTALARLQDDVPQLRSAFRSGISLTAALVIPISAFITVMAPELVRCLMGPNWDGAVLPLQILAPTMFFRTAYKIAAVSVRAQGAVNLLAITQVSYALSVVAGAFLGCRFGLAGAAVGVGCAVFFQYLFLVGAGARLLGLPVIRTLLPSYQPLLLGGTAAALTWGISRLCGLAAVSSPLRLLFSGMAFLGLVGVARRVAPNKALGPELVRVLDAAWRRVALVWGSRPAAPEPNSGH